MEKPLYLEHRKRLRERFLKAGAQGLHDYELLELILTYAIPRKDVKPLAKELIKKFGSFSGVLNTKPQELQTVSGIGPNSAILLSLIKEASTLYLAEKMVSKDLLSSPQAAVDFARAKLSDRTNEVFMLLYLNTKNEAIGYEIIHEGTIDSSVVYPRRIIEGAINHHASGLILVHNHPSGHIEPSPEDMHLTEIISEATKAIDIRILDHIIVGKGGYFSFAENHLLRFA